MPIDTDTIDRLTDRLTTPDPSPLTDDERALLVAALAELAAAHAVIATQERLLMLHGELRSRLRSITGEALAQVRDRLDETAALAGYDADAADAARRALLAEIESANSTRATLAATLGFAARLFGLRSG